ncbi:hypothetical protein QYM41_13480 [Kocuria sp. CPCC 205268]|uniref:hypothetical protein n=1 Tax=Kocuria oxytropis TaxID=3058913 RepID=UPI0034D3EC90
MTLERPRTEAPAAEDHPQAPVSAEAAEQPEKKSPALNVPGLLAGAATAATMSVIGGHLSVVGTVLGAALTSIVSGIAVVVYSTSLEKSRRGLRKVRTTVAERVLARPGLDASGSDGSTAVAAESRWSTLRPRLKPILVSTGAILGLAVAAVFGIQALTGTELSGGTGTIQRSVTGSESVAVRSASTPAPAEDPAAGTGELAPAEGTAPTAETTSAPEGIVPAETAPTAGTVTGDAGTSGGELPDTGSQQLDSGQTGAVPPDAAGQGVADAGAVPAAP